MMSINRIGKPGSPAKHNFLQNSILGVYNSDGFQRLPDYDKTRKELYGLWFEKFGSILGIDVNNNKQLYWSENKIYQRFSKACKELDIEFYIPSGTEWQNLLEHIIFDAFSKSSKQVLFQYQRPGGSGARPDCMVVDHLDNVTIFDAKKDAPMKFTDQTDKYTKFPKVQKVYFVYLNEADHFKLTPDQKSKNQNGIPIYIMSALDFLKKLKEMSFVPNEFKNETQYEKEINKLLKKL